MYKFAVKNIPLPLSKEGNYGKHLSKKKGVIKL